MRLYDTVEAVCPNCSATVKFQCLGVDRCGQGPNYRHYTLSELSKRQILDIKNDYQDCKKCDSRVGIHMLKKRKIIRIGGYHKKVNAYKAFAYLIDEDSDFTSDEEEQNDCVDEKWVELD